METCEKVKKSVTISLIKQDLNDVKNSKGIWEEKMIKDGRFSIRKCSRLKQKFAAAVCIAILVSSCGGYVSPVEAAAEDGFLNMKDYARVNAQADGQSGLSNDCVTISIDEIIKKWGRCTRG